MAPMSGAAWFSPHFYESKTNSPSVSPTRHGRTRSHDDGLLQGISPMLQAFAADSSPSKRDPAQEDGILRSLTATSSSEKALGLRVAKAAAKLKAWCDEIEQWGWAGNFETPDAEELETQKKSLERHLQSNGKSRKSLDAVKSLEYWGCLPSVQVEAYEDRIEEIGDELEALDLDELKEHVLTIHSGRSRPTSSYETAHANLTLLDDFSLVITHTLMQALPYLTQLRQHLDTWSVRLLVLREIPGYLRQLNQAQIAIESGWDVIAPSDDSNVPFKSVTAYQDAIGTIRGVLQEKVSDLGHRLDRMLDALEGREDTLPEHWIDEFELLETDYGGWVMEAQKRILEIEMRLPKDEKSNASRSNGLGSENPLAKTSVMEDLIPDSMNHLVREVSLSDSLYEDIYSFSPEKVGPRIPSTAPPDLRLQIPDSPTLPDETKSNGAGDESDKDMEGGYVAEATSVKPVLSVKRASIASIHSFSGSQLKSIDVRRSGSFSSVSSTPQRQPSRDASAPGSPVDVERRESIRHSQPSAPLATTAEEVHVSSVDFAPQTPIRELESHKLQHSGSVFSQSSASTHHHSSPLSVIDDSPSIRQVTNRPAAKVPKPPLNSAMTKRRNKDEANALRTPRRVSEPLGAKDPASRDSPSQSPYGAEDLDTQISNILTTIPAPIRLTSGAEPDAPEIKPSKGLANGRFSAVHAIRPNSPALTLSPAKSDDSSSRRMGGSGGDPDIKLYHLTQPGREKPIKLFVRRVGENGERVMVRVGGGWADLAEYLRQYAEHHGRRTVSDGKFELFGLSTPGQDASTPRPGSAHGSKTLNMSTIPLGGTPPIPNRSAMRPTPLNTTAGNTSGQRVEAAPDSAGSATSSRSWMGEEVGLAGPATKKLDLAGDKLEWIEGMVDRARKISIGTRGDFGDLGRVNGTKRVYMKAQGGIE